MNGADNEFIIISINTEQKEKVIKSLREAFYADEPLNASVDLINEPGSCKLIDEYCSNIIDKGLSVAAVSKSGDIVGVCLISDKCKETLKCDESGNQGDDNDLHFPKIMNLLDFVNNHCDPFEIFPNASKLLEIDVLSVNGKYRGKGIAKMLVNEVRKIAEKRDFHLIKVICTSHFSAKTAASLGFKNVYKLPYSEFVDSRNRQIFEPAVPHTQIEMYVFEVGAATDHR